MDIPGAVGAQINPEYKLERGYDYVAKLKKS